MTIRKVRGEYSLALRWVLGSAVYTKAVNLNQRKKEPNQFILCNARSTSFYRKNYRASLDLQCGCFNLIRMILRLVLNFSFQKMTRSVKQLFYSIKSKTKQSTLETASFLDKLMYRRWTGNGVGCLVQEDMLSREWSSGVQTLGQGFLEEKGLGVREE